MPPRRNPEPRYSLKRNLRGLTEHERGSAAEFCRRYDVSPSTFRNWIDLENNILPNAEQLIDLADFFHTTPDELVRGTPRVMDEQIQRIADLLSRMSREELEHIEYWLIRLTEAVPDDLPRTSERGPPAG